MSRLILWRRKRAALLLALAIFPAALCANIPAGLGTSSAAAQGAEQEVPALLQQTLARVTAQPRYRHATWGVAIAELATGQILYGQNAKRMFVPGSIMKTYSAANALDAYGPDYQFRTPVYRDGPVANGALRGNLILVAAGDLSFGLREQPDGTLAYNNAPEFDHTYANNVPYAALLPGNPLAALDELAAEVKAAGIREVRGEVIVDARLFETSIWPDGLVSPIWVNENLIDVLITPGRAGRQAQIALRPVTSVYRLDAKVKTVDAGQPADLRLDSPLPGVIRVRGEIAADSKPALRVWPVEDPAAFARTAFIDALRRAGIAVRAATVAPNPAALLPAPNSYPAIARVAEYVSAPLAEIAKIVLKVSHNPGAALLNCLSAAASGSRNCADGLVRATALFTQLGAAPESTFAFDGAGSDERDRTTPADMTAFLRGVAQQSFGAALRAGLPILGVDGSVGETAKNTPAAGRVFVKTGARAAGTPAGQGLVTGMTYVGYADAQSGRRLTLAIMVRDVAIGGVDDLLVIDADLGAIAAAIQQSY